MIPVWKKEKTELKTVHSHTLQDVTMRVSLAFQAFFHRVKAGEKAVYPRFKGKGCRTYAVELKNQQHQTVNCLKRDFNLQSLT